MNSTGWILALALVATLPISLLARAAARAAVEPGAGEAAANQPPKDLTLEDICRVFGGPSCATELPGLYNACDCPDDSGDRCECVYFYQCDNSTGSYDVDGKGLFDIRKQDGCPAVELRCCKIDVPHDKRSPDEPVTPHPNYPPVPVPVPQAGECGEHHAGGVNSEIVNNAQGEAGFGEFPWVAAILLQSKDPQGPETFKCGGAIIALNVVLTAAHCVRGQPARRLKVRAGEWDRESESELYKHQDRPVSRVVIHDQYYGGNYHYDVALLFLDGAFELGYHIGTVCLPEQSEDGSGAFYGKECLVNGWGKDKLEDQWPHRYLKRLELDVVPRGDCERLLRATELGERFSLHQSFVCAGGQEGKDTCKGDGGGPLVCPTAQGGRYELAGVVAWGVDCGRAGVPGLYASVAAVRSWIDDQLRLAGA